MNILIQNERPRSESRNLLLYQIENVIMGFPLDLNDLKNKWSRHRSFLYGCDRSPEMHVLKLGIEIPNLKQHN